VRVAFLLIALEIVEESVYGHDPLNLLRPKPLAILAFALIVLGTAFRLSALGCIRKNEEVENRGVYSLCRHPLYFGSLLLLVGFLVLMNDIPMLVVAVLYFVIFYVAAIIREERFLTSKFPDSYARYCSLTPRLIPYGRFVPGRFSLVRAMRRGGVGLFVAVLLLLGGIQVLGIVRAHRADTAPRSPEAPATTQHGPTPSAPK